MAKIRHKRLAKSADAEAKNRTCAEISIDGHIIHTDEPPSRGGTDVGPPPFDTFIAMLTGCSHVILSLIASELNVTVDHMKIHLETELDVRGIYNIADVTRPIERLDLHFDFATDATQEQLATIKATLAKRCPVNVVMTQAGINIVEHWQTRSL